MVNNTKLTDIIAFLGEEVIEVKGNADGVYVDRITSPINTTETTLDWTNSLNEAKQKITEDTIAKVVVVAVIDDSAEIAPTTYIEAGCVIGRNCKIGANTVLRANVVLYDNVSIGDNCLLQAGAILGTDGLGCEREDDGTLIKFPHQAGIRVGNNVEIGANCQIARGLFDDTIIEDGCKMNGLTFIAHNSHLSENVWITGDTMLCGSTHVDKNATIFSKVIVREQTHIGKGAIIGMGSVLTKNVPDGETWYGAPARKKE